MGDNRSMASRVLDGVRLDIINGVYVPEQLITEAEISKRYQVSKTPAREALINLCMEGLLEKIPYKGYFVKSINISDLKALFEFRRILECAIIELVIGRLTPSELQVLEELAHVRLDPGEEDWLNKYNDINSSFHMALAKMTGNPYIISSFERTLNRMRRALIMDLKNTDVNQLLHTHVLIVEALKAKDLEAALAQTSEGIIIVEHRMYL